MLMVFLVSVVFAGCGTKSSTQTSGKVLRVANGSEPETLDPRKAIGIPESIVMRQIFEGLCTQNQKGDPIPGAAEKWEISQDGLVYKFFLRKDAKWSNGDAVTARDFEYSWKSTLDPKFGSRYAEQLYYLKNAEAFNKGKASRDEVGVKALDDTTLEVTLERPTPFFLFLTTFFTYFPVHQKTVESNPQWNAEPKTLIGNGPFKMTGWVHNSKIELVKNEYYWNKGVVKLDKVEMVLSDSKKTVIDMFENNQLDTVEVNPPAQDLERLGKAGVLKNLPFISIYHYMCNVTKPPLDDVRVRKALAYAIDRQAIINTLTKGGEKAALAWVPYGLPDAKPGDDFRKNGGNYFKDNDIETAKKLLAEAGYPDGKGMPTITMLYNTNETHKAIAEAIQEMWKKNLGVNAELVNQEWKVYLQSRNQGTFMLARREWVGDYLDPMTCLEFMQGTQSNNNTRWKNDKYDSLVQEAKMTTDPQKRMQLMHEAEKILIEDMPSLPIYFGTQKVLEKPYVKGIIRDSLGAVYLREASIEK